MEAGERRAERPLSTDTKYYFEQHGICSQLLISVCLRKVVAVSSGVLKSGRRLVSLGTDFFFTL